MTQLSNLSPLGGERNDAIDHCLGGIAKLSREVNEATQQLPAYDQRTYSEAVKALSEKLQTVRDGLAPRPKFTFRGQLRTRGRGTQPKAATAATAHKVGSPAQTTTSGVDDRVKKISDGEEMLETINGQIRDQKITIHRPSFLNASQLALFDHSNSHIQLPPLSAPPGSSSTFRDLKSCVIDISAASPSSAPLAGLTVRDVSKSVIICGVISGPIHITGVTDSILVVACRQYRMHECRNVDVYLHCGSNPIVEDVEGVSFTPLPESYMDENLKAVKNHWDKVDDFKWLKADASPNWSILPESKRLPEDFWTKTILSEDVDVDTLLKAV